MTSSPAGTYDLLVPTDMFNVMVPPERDQAEIAFRDLFARMFPSAGSAELDILSDGLLRWREALLERGVIFHGVVAAPAGFEYEGHVYGEAHWHVLAGVTPVPVHDDDIDPGAVAARALAADYDDDTTYSESFETRMGWGAGVITELTLSTITATPGRKGPTGVPTDAVPDRIALALGMAGRHGSDHALFVAGLAFDVEQKHEMAAVVALMTGQSSIDVEVTTR